jgi:hypothetical protein
MRLSIEQRFAHGVEAVLDTLTDPAFIAGMAELPKLGQPQLLVREQRGTQLTLHVRYAFVGQLSGAVRRVVDPAKLTWVEESTVDLTSHSSAFQIVPDYYGPLLRCAGSTELSATAGGSARVTTGDLRVSVPLVAGRVERAIVSGLQEHATAEAELVDSWLAAHGSSPGG